MGFLKFVKTLGIIAGFIVPIASLAEVAIVGEKMGPERRKEVLKQLKEQIAAAGIELPGWAAEHLDIILGLLIDFVVFVLNKTGFFNLGE